MFPRKRDWFRSPSRRAARPPGNSGSNVLAPGTARDHVRVARALKELPAIRGEFAAGRFSYSKVRALARIATPQTAITGTFRPEDGAVILQALRAGRADLEHPHDEGKEPSA